MSSGAYFRGSDGTRFFFQDLHPSENDQTKSNDPLVFCYGLVCSDLHWKYQKAFFAKNNRRIIWMDYRGHHASAWPKRSETINSLQLAEDLKELLDFLEVPQANFLGHSFGVQILLHFARRYPEMVSSLVLANGAGKNFLEDVFNTNASDIFAPLLYRIHDFEPNLMDRAWKYLGDQKLANWLIFLAGFNPQLAKLDDVKAYIQAAKLLPAPIFIQLLQDMQGFNSLPWLSEIQCPSLILAGERDRITPPKNQKVMAQLMNKSHYLEVPLGSHCPQMDRPGFVNEAIKTFLEEHKI
jgi:pimeloyl-ACP methyl ester carboxylesterase